MPTHYTAYDYHGLGVADAAAKFVSDYNQELCSNAGSKYFKIVHGYGSTDRGGKICEMIRAMLAFESRAGVLDYVASEEAYSNPGFSLIRPIKELAEIAVGLLTSCFDRDIALGLSQKINSWIRERYTAPKPRKVIPKVLPKIDAVPTGRVIKHNASSCTYEYCPLCRPEARAALLASLSGKKGTKK